MAVFYAHSSFITSYSFPIALSTEKEVLGHHHNGGVFFSVWSYLEVGGLERKAEN